MKKKSYIFTNKKHSKRAIMSFILGCISMISMGIVIFLTYQKAGVAKPGYGMTGLFSLIFSLIGLILGVLTLQERENYRLFPWLGTILNLIVFCGLAFLLYWGRTV